MTQRFYDDLAPLYHLIFADWDTSILRQAEILDRVIRHEWREGVTSVLDVACGIGTQALGLAERGYDMTASDLSPQMVARAREEAAQRGVQIEFSVADMRQASMHHKRTFDVVIACDNAVPHLLNDDAVLDAFRAFYRCVNPGGGCLITVRDYDEVERSGTRVVPYGFREESGTTYFLFQVWVFDGDCYELSMYVMEEGGSVEGDVFHSRYYAVSSTRLEELLREAGFGCVRQVESDFYQPVLVGTRE